MMDEESARAYYIQAKLLSEHVEKLQEHISDIEDKQLEVRMMYESLEDIKQSSDEALVPLTTGIFLPATLKNTSSVIVNVGASTMVRKTTNEAIKMLKEQFDELSEYKKKVHAQYIRAYEQLSEFQDMIASKVQDV